MIVLLDINETLIRTGRVSLQDRLFQERALEDFVEVCRRLGGRPEGLLLVLATGNSFEYTRRVEEPLGLSHLPGVETVIASENGLIGRSFRAGELWRVEPAYAYTEKLQEFLGALARSRPLAGRYYLQGNEVRCTVKPVMNSFSDAELEAITQVAESVGLPSVAVLYCHRFYVDLDPLSVFVNGAVRENVGKSYALERLANAKEGPIVAIGDSASDLGLFESVWALGGRCFGVANACPSIFSDLRIERTAGAFASGVIEAVEASLSIASRT